LSLANPTPSSLFDLYDSVSKGQDALLCTLTKLFNCQRVSIKTSLIQEPSQYSNTAANEENDLHRRHHSVTAPAATKDDSCENAEHNTFVFNNNSAQLIFKSNQVTFTYLQIEFDASEYSEDQLNSPEIEYLLPHISQALDMSYQISQQETDLRSVHYVLDHYPIPAIAIDNHFNTIFSNQAARHFLHSIDKGRKSLRDVARGDINLIKLCSQEKQKQELRQTLSKSFSDKNLTAQYLLIDIEKSRTPLIISPSDGVPDSFNHIARDALSWVYFLQTDYSQTLKAHPSFKRLKLSSAESELATSLFEGNSLSEIAENRRVSKQTVRKQLQSVLRKTQCETQENLVLFFFENCIRYSLMNALSGSNLKAINQAGIDD